MIRSLIKIAAGGALIFVLCMGALLFYWPSHFELNLPSSFKFSLDEGGDDAHKLTRTLPWEGGHGLVVDIPAQIIVKQGDKPEITLKGPEDLVKKVELHGSTLSFKDKETHHYTWHSSKTTLVVTAPALNTVTINGAGSLNFQDYHQKTLTLMINGAANVKGSGQADDVKIVIDGAASVYLADIKMRNLDLSMNGAGSVKAGPSDSAMINIAGAGTVRLTQTPASLVKIISGLGHVSVDDNKSEAKAQPGYSGAEHPSEDDDDDDDSSGSDNDDASF